MINQIKTNKILTSPCSLMNLKKIMDLKVKLINEKKDRVTVLHIENLTKPLYQVFPKRLDLFFLLHSFSIVLENQS